MGHLAAATMLALLVGAAVAGQCMAKKARPSPLPTPPLLPLQYMLTGTVTMPEAGVTEPFRSFYDGANNRHVRVFVRACGQRACGPLA
jgi:hypothetical protein